MHTKKKSRVGLKNFVNASHGWDRINLEVISARSWQKRTIPLEIHWDLPEKFKENGGVEVERL